jgi:hypothetical protein
MATRPNPPTPPTHPAPTSTPRLPVPVTVDVLDQRLRPIFILSIATLGFITVMTLGYVYEGPNLLHIDTADH